MTRHRHSTLSPHVRPPSKPDPKQVFCRVLVLRPTLGVEVGADSRVFETGEVLEGQLVQHPVNAFRKLILRTPTGTLTLNQEDVTVFEGPQGEAELNLNPSHAGPALHRPDLSRYVRRKRS